MRRSVGRGVARWCWRRRGRTATVRPPILRSTSPDLDVGGPVRADGSTGHPGGRGDVPVVVGVGAAVECGRGPLVDRGRAGIRHRLPQLWERVKAGEVLAWKAREVARRTTELSMLSARVVDRIVTGRWSCSPGAGSRSCSMRPCCRSMRRPTSSGRLGRRRNGMCEPPSPPTVTEPWSPGSTPGMRPHSWRW